MSATATSTSICCRRAALLHEAEATIFAILDGYDGSISAEHGIGRAKRAAFLERIDPVSLDLARGLKRMLDPAGILSVSRILPPEPPARPT